MVSATLGDEGIHGGLDVVVAGCVDVVVEVSSSLLLLFANFPFECGVAFAECRDVL